MKATNKKKMRRPFHALCSKERGDFVAEQNFIELNVVHNADSTNRKWQAKKPVHSESSEPAEWI